MLKSKKKKRRPGLYFKLVTTYLSMSDIVCCEGFHPRSSVYMSLFQKLIFLMENTEGQR